MLCGVGDDADGSADPAQLAVIDSATLAVKARISAAGAHIEGFDLDAGSSTDVMASTPDNGDVVRIDVAAGKIVASFALPGEATPLAWDSAAEIVMAATRKPPALVVLDVSAAGKGRVVYTHEVADDADDLHWDAAAGMVYVSGGGNKTSAGAIACFFRNASTGDFAFLGSVGPAGKNSEYSADKRTIWTTVPATADADAYIQTFLTH